MVIVPLWKVITGRGTFQNVCVTCSQPAFHTYIISCMFTANMEQCKQPLKLVIIHICSSYSTSVAWQVVISQSLHCFRWHKMPTHGLRNHIFNINKTETLLVFTSQTWRLRFHWCPRFLSLLLYFKLVFIQQSRLKTEINKCPNKGLKRSCWVRMRG